MVEVRREVRPVWPLRLPGGGMDGVLRRDGAVRTRLMHVEDEAAVVRLAQPSAGRIVLGATADRRRRRRGGDRADVLRARRRRRPAPVLRPLPRRPADRSLGPRAAASARAPAPRSVRGARLGDLRAAHRVRARRGDRAADRAGRWAAAARGPGCATCRRRGRWPGSRRRACRRSTSRAGRALALRRAAREVAAGRADLRAPDHERGWRRLRAIPGIGRWTIEMLALHGQGRYDQIPAADVGYLKLVGRLQQQTPARPRDRGRGARLLRALRGLGRPRRRPRAGYGVGVRVFVPASPSPGRNSFVSSRVGSAGCLMSLFCSIQSP